MGGTWGGRASDDGALIRQPGGRWGGDIIDIGRGQAPFRLRWLAVAAPIVTPRAATAASYHTAAEQDFHLGRFDALLHSWEVSTSATYPQRAAGSGSPGCLVAVDLPGVVRGEF